MPLERACAAAVRLLDLGYFRIGNDVYADENGIFGLTTLERRHVGASQDRAGLRLRRASPAIEHDIEIDDAVVIEAIEVMRRRRQRRRPAACCPTRTAGRGGRCCRIWSTSTCATRPGSRSTAKDFRTWHATVLAAAALAETPEPGLTKASRKRAVAGAMKEVAAFLGNTPALARSSYVDPRVIDAYEEGRTIERATRRSYETTDERQAALERATLRLLKES